MQTAFREREGQFSPDGRWAAYSSDESGREEVYVIHFPDASGKRQVSTGGGRAPRWRKDGKEIFYVSRDGSGRLMAASATIKPDSVEFSMPKALPITISPFRSIYSVSADGQRFLILPHEQSSTGSITVVTNWQAGLKK